MHPQNGGVGHMGCFGSVRPVAEMRRTLSASHNNGSIALQRQLSGMPPHQNSQPPRQPTADLHRTVSQTGRLRPTFQDLQEDVPGTANNKNQMLPQPSGYSPAAPGNTSFLPPVAAVPPGYPTTNGPAAASHLQAGGMSGSYYGLPSAGSLSNYGPFSSQYSLSAGGLGSLPFATGSAYATNPAASCYSIGSRADSTFNSLDGWMGSMYSLGGPTGTNALPTSLGSQYGEAFGLGGSLAGSMHGSFSSVANPCIDPLAGGVHVFQGQHPNLSEGVLSASIMNNANAGEKMKMLNSVNGTVGAGLQDGDAGATSFSNGSGTNAVSPSMELNGNSTHPGAIAVKADKLLTAFDRNAPILNLAVVTNNVTIAGGTNMFVTLRDDAGTICSCAAAESLNVHNMSASHVLKLALKNILLGRNISIFIMHSPIIALRDLPRFLVRALARRFTQDKTVVKWVLSCRAAVMPTPQRMRDLQDPDAKERKAAFSATTTAGTLIRSLKTKKVATEKDAVDHITALLAVPCAPNESTVVQYLVSCMRHKKVTTRSMTFVLTRDLNYLKAPKIGVKIPIPVLGAAFATNSRTSIVIPITGAGNHIQWEAEAMSLSSMLLNRKK